MIFTGKTKVWVTTYGYSIDDVIHTVNEGDDVSAVSMLTYNDTDMSDTGWVEVGEAEITVTLKPRDQFQEKELEKLKQQLKQVRADNVMRENLILDRISKLQAISYNGEEV